MQQQSVDGRVIARVGGFNLMRGSIRDLLRGAIRDLMRGAIRDLLRGAIRDLLRGAIRDLIGGAIREAVREATRGQQWPPVAICGHQWHSVALRVARVDPTVGWIGSG